MNYRMSVIVSFLFISTSVSAVPFKVIEKDTFKGVWPFSFKEAQLQCLNGALYVMNPDDNKEYALNGLAWERGKDTGYFPLKPDSKVWLDNPKIPGTKMDLSDVTSAALALCGK